MLKKDTDTAQVYGEKPKYQIHKMHVSLFDGVQEKLIDYTEHKLLKIIDKVSDFKIKSNLLLVLDDYRNGKIAVGWRNGFPVCVQVFPVSTKKK